MKKLDKQSLKRVCPVNCPSADGFRTFFEFDWSSIDHNLLALAWHQSFYSDSWRSQARPTQLMQIVSAIEWISLLFFSKFSEEQENEIV